LRSWREKLPAKISTKPKIFFIGRVKVIDARNCFESNSGGKVFPPEALF
jgi:hypothetical protein